MDEGLIWTREEIVRFTHDASYEIRSWAWSWLYRHHPAEAGYQAARGLADPFIPIALEALAAFEVHPTPEALKVIEEMRRRDDLDPALRAAIDVAQGRRARESLRRPGRCDSVPLGRPGRTAAPQRHTRWAWASRSLTVEASTSLPEGRARTLLSVAPCWLAA